MNDKVSIIIPIYNGEQYLEECVASIRNQDFPHWEAIFVDDGSTDGSSALLHAVAVDDPRIHVFGKKNGGVSSARNLGLEKCVGKYVCFVDIDDVIEPDFLSTLLAGYDTAGTDLTICGYTRQMAGPVDRSSRWDRYDSHTAIEKIFSRKLNFQICTMLFLREIVTLHGLRFTEGCTRREDFEFLMKYILHTSHIGVNTSELYRYRVNESSAMYTFNKSSLTSLEASERIISYYNNAGHPLAGYVEKYCLSPVILKFLVKTTLRKNAPIKDHIYKNYAVKEELKKLYDYPNRSIALAARLHNFSKTLFEVTLTLLGFIYNKKN